MKVDHMRSPEEQVESHQYKHPTFIARVADLDEKNLIGKIQSYLRPQLQGKMRRPINATFIGWGLRTECLEPAGYEFYLNNPADFWTVFHALQKFPSVVDMEVVGQWWQRNTDPSLSLRRIKLTKFKTCNKQWIARMKREAEFAQLIAGIKSQDNVRFSIKSRESLETETWLQQNIKIEVEMAVAYGSSLQGGLLDYLHAAPVQLPADKVLDYIAECINTGALRLPIEAMNKHDWPAYIFLQYGRYDLRCIYQDDQGKRYARTTVNTGSSYDDGCYNARYYVFYRGV